MRDALFSLLLYFGQLLLLTLGIVALCGLSVHLLSKLFSWLMGGGSGSFFDFTAVIGTPIHELGHAAMCLLFGHRIERIKLWSPTARGGTYGYVEHSYNRHNPWARMGNLFIGLGPIFSGLAVIVLMLHLCFPTPWSAYLETSRELIASGASPSELLSGVLSLLLGLPRAFAADWLRSLLGLLVILPVSLHVTLSWQDVKGCLGALPIYLAMLAVFSLVTFAAGVNAPIASSLWLFNLRLLSLFSLVIAFSALWVVIALILRLCRTVIGWF